jgi:hypothetical protein
LLIKDEARRIAANIAKGRIYVKTSNLLSPPDISTSEMVGALPKKHSFTPERFPGSQSAPAAQKSGGLNIAKRPELLR